MGRRGAYAKGVAKREEILDAALTVIARNGYQRTSVRDIAEAVGLSQAGLLHYFASKEALFAEVLRRRDEVDRERMPADPAARVEGLIEIMRHNADVPGLVQLYAELSTEASHPEHAAHDFFTQRYAVLRRELGETVRAAQERGELSTSLDAESVATILLASADGLQTQWMLEPGLDMAARLEHLWAALCRVP
ncbi:TetR/AcrR family transcriptional regulator [Humibacillus xanthopallidus]|nr:TetR/AcrR family transcriptional regulator [Humibacillus xanthopallidus]